MFLLNSCLGQFSAATLRWHPFSRSYGVNLPSSLTTILPMVLGFSPHLPVSVCGTGSMSLLRGFSWQRELGYFRISEYARRDLPPLTPSNTSTGSSNRLLPYPPASPHRVNASCRYLNINRLSITYASQPRLRPRLTLSGRTFLRKP